MGEGGVKTSKKVRQDMFLDVSCIFVVFWGVFLSVVSSFQVFPDVFGVFE